MNRNQRIVVSIVGIIIVTLALIGITYAYFLTKIIGNSTSTSISGTLANLELTYGDGNGIIAPTDPIMPGTTLTSKTFTVKNTGTVDVDNYVVMLEDITNELARNGDLVYSLICEDDCSGVEEDIFPTDDIAIVSNSIKQGETQNYTLTITYKNYDDVDQSVDMGKTFSAKVNIRDKNDVNPYKSNTDSLAYKIINGALFAATGETTYRARPLTEPAVETSVNADELIEKDFGQYTFTPSNYYLSYANGYTTDIRDTSPYSNFFVLTSVQQGYYNSIYNNLKGKYITFSSAASSELFEVIDATSSKLTLKRHRMVQESKESTLSQISDVYGTSYYYRGDVTDNYLTFNNMCWKIVRIQGDGSTKIVLQDPTAPCSEKTNEEYPFIDRGTWGYKKGTINYENDYLNCGADSSTCMKNKFDSWFNSKFTSVKNKLKEETWYLGDTTNRYEKSSSSYYEAGQRLNGYGTTRGVSLLSKINGFTSYIGTLTADEMALAGAMTYEGSNYNNQNYYLFVPSGAYWTLSLLNRYSSYDYAYYSSDYLSDFFVNSLVALRPVLVLKPNTTATGQGTKSNPYIVK